MTNDLGKILEIERNISVIAERKIIFSPAIITLNSTPIIRRGTINVIQGRQGSHKSRLAELLCTMMLRQNNDTNLSLGFERRTDQAVTICYIDTERNKNEEFAASIQSIVRNAGYHAPKDIPRFRFTSLKDIDRGNRLKVLRQFIDTVRCGAKEPLFVVLDVVTDCIMNFNDPTESLELLDYIGKLTESYDATFILVIHENPGADKARGHVGTEAINKASTVIRIGFNKKDTNGTRDGLRMEFVKTRHSDLPSNIALRFCSETKSLQMSDHNIFPAKNGTRAKADLEQVKTRLQDYLQTSMNQQDLLKMLAEEFKCSENTMRARLAEIANEGNDFVNLQGIPCKLQVNSSPGKVTTYSLLEIEINALM